MNTFPLLSANPYIGAEQFYVWGDSMSDVRPDYLVRVVKDIGGKDRWTDVGVAYKNARGSITIYLSALPLNDKILLIPTKGDYE
ncbi:MAG: hypothetical protein AYK18_07485 [Theionarchaea archaeon DG-70]|nr:MAG: hypothetical protein AYK18_07485 [Theionarchaea archaeon DG-70]